MSLLCSALLRRLLALVLNWLTLRLPAYTRSYVCIDWIFSIYALCSYYRIVIPIFRYSHFSLLFLFPSPSGLLILCTIVHFPLLTVHIYRFHFFFTFVSL